MSARARSLVFLVALAAGFVSFAPREADGETTRQICIRGCIETKSTCNEKCTGKHGAKTSCTNRCIKAHNRCIHECR